MLRPVRKESPKADLLKNVETLGSRFFEHAEFEKDWYVRPMVRELLKEARSSIVSCARLRDIERDLKFYQKFYLFR